MVNSITWASLHHFFSSPSQLHLSVQWWRHRSSPLPQLSPQAVAPWTACWGCCSRTWADKEFRHPPRETVQLVRSQWSGRWVNGICLCKLVTTWLYSYLELKTLPVPIIPVYISKTYIYVKPTFFPGVGGNSSGKGVAPGALCVHWVRDRVRQSQLLREGRAAVLRVGLLHPVLPPLCPLQQAHPQCEQLRNSDVRGSHNRSTNSLIRPLLPLVV